MKIKVLFFFCCAFANPLFTMEIEHLVINIAPEKNLLTRIIENAINEGNVKEINEIVNEIRKPTQSNYGSLKALVNPNQIDPEPLYGRAKNLERETDLQASTICNLHFYKNLALGSACWTAAIGLGTLFVAIPITQGQFDFLKNIGVAGTISSGLLGLGTKFFHSAWSNEDAINEHAKQLAIRLLLHKLRYKR